MPETVSLLAKEEKEDEWPSNLVYVCVCTFCIASQWLFGWFLFSLQIEEPFLNAGHDPN